MQTAIPKVSEVVQFGCAQPGRYMQMEILAFFPLSAQERHTKNVKFAKNL
jgi:hypothetical protein